MRLSRCFRGSGVAVAFLLALSAGCGNAAPTGVLTGSFRIEEGGPAGLHTLPIFGHIVIFQGSRPRGIPEGEVEHFVPRFWFLRAPIGSAPRARRHRIL